MRILALIPARGGSKRLPGKNIKLLGDRPLINWTIEAAAGIPEICEILVSTDSPEIASIAKISGASVPWLRPEILSSDSATSVDVALHALDWYEKTYGEIDGLLLLQPTSPYRTTSTIKMGIKLFIEYDQQPVISVSPSPSHPCWSFKQEGKYIVPFMEMHQFGMRSQDLPPSYFPNGALYLVSPSYIRKTHSFGENKAIPCHLTSVKEAIDIDSPTDFEFARYMLNQDY